MDRRTARLVELAVLVPTGLLGLLTALLSLIVGFFVALSADFTILYSAIIGTCVLGPLYVAWVIWFCIRTKRTENQGSRK